MTGKLDDSLHVTHLCVCARTCVSQATAVCSELLQASLLQAQALSSHLSQILTPLKIFQRRSWGPVGTARAIKPQKRVSKYQLLQLCDLG